MKNKKSRFQTIIEDIEGELRPFGIYLKSHCEAPDFEAEVMARSKRGALYIFKQGPLGELGDEFLLEHIEEIIELD